MIKLSDLLSCTLPEHDKLAGIQILEAKRLEARENMLHLSSEESTPLLSNEGIELFVTLDENGKCREMVYGRELAMKRLSRDSTVKYVAQIMSPKFGTVGSRIVAQK